MLKLFTELNNITKFKWRQLEKIFKKQLIGAKLYKYFYETCEKKNFLIPKHMKINIKLHLKYKKKRFL